jgi:hypothetical protein
VSSRRRCAGFKGISTAFFLEMASMTLLNADFKSLASISFRADSVSLFIIFAPLLVTAAAAHGSDESGPNTSLIDEKQIISLNKAVLRLANGQNLNAMELFNSRSVDPGAELPMPTGNVITADDDDARAVAFP